MKRLPLRRTLFTVIAVCLTAIVLAVPTALGGRMQRIDLAAGRFDVGELTPVLVKVESSGFTFDGREFAGTGYGVVIDPSGLILANAHVAAPDSPGLAATFWDPSISAIADQTVISTSAGVGQPLVPMYYADVVAADGYMNVAILQITTNIADGTPVGELALPSLPLSTATAVVGDPVTFATYADLDATSVLTGDETGYTELVGAVTFLNYDPRIGGPLSNFQISVAAPTINSGGVAVDGAGAVIGLPIWYPGTAPSEINIASAPLIQPLLDAATAGTEYVSPYTVLGTGQEALIFAGWRDALEFACLDLGIDPVTNYPSGALEIDAAFSYDGFTDGEDVLEVWYDPTSQTLIFVDLDPWVGGTTGTCYATGISRVDDQPLADGRYALSVSAGEYLIREANVETTVGEVPDGTINVVGRIIDADTGQPIAGAQVNVLEQGVDPQSWYNAPDTNLVAASDTTDSDGTYSTEPAIAPGVYPYVITASGYNPVGGSLDLTAGGLLNDIGLVSNE